MTEEVKAENTPEQKTVQEEIVKTTESVPAESAPDIKSEANKENWKKFREEREAQRKATLQAQQAAEKSHAEAQALKAAMESLLNTNQNTPTYSNDSEEDIISKKVKEALDRERQIHAEAVKKREIEELPQKLNQTYRDFNNVCTQEHLDYLEFHYPEVAVGYKYMPDSFDRWSAMYQAIKRFVPLGHKEDLQRIQENQMKPKSSIPNMTDTKPVGSPWILSEERKKANWERMQRDQKNIA